MSGAVVQRFLDNAVDACLVWSGKIIWDSLGSHVDSYVCAPGDFTGLPFKRWDQAEVVEHGRTKQQGHVANDTNAVLSQIANAIYVRFQFAEGGRRYGGAQIPQADQQGRQRLAHFIVQLAGNSGSLVLLRLYQP